MESLLIIGFVWPEPNSSAAGGRMMQLISIFQQQGFAITFASPAQDSDFMVDLNAFDVEKKSIKLNSDSFDVFIKDLNPAVVVFDRFMIEEQFGWRVVDNCPQALRILDTEDLHCLRLARQKAFKDKRLFLVDDIIDEEVAKREIASVLRCDMTLMISQYEIAVLQDIFKIGSSLLFYLPLLLNEAELPIQADLKTYQERSDFVFIGNFLHEPNWNAVQYLKETIWPLIRKRLPTAILNIYGAYPSQKVMQLHNVKEGFIIHGRVEQASKVVMQARVVLAPLRFGAGIKGKLIEAMQYGTPSITTSIGAEAMHGDLPWNGAICDDPNEFAVSAVAVYGDEALWEDAQKKGVHLLQLCYSRKLFEDDFRNAVKKLQNDLVQHRKYNFLGQLLHYHTTRSTKYMSKWIEEKNK